MARRGENIRKRKDGRWEARYQKGRREDGRIEYGYVYAKKYSEVKQKRNNIINSFNELKEESVLQKGPAKVPTLNNLFDLWKSDIHQNIKESSYCFYETILEHHLRPYFGELYINQLTVSVAQKFINNKLEENLSSTYIRSIMILLQNILKTTQYEYQSEIQIPVIQLPKAVKKTPEIFSIQEWKCLVNYLKSKNDDFSFGILICMYTGIRIGELSGLRWEDYDSSIVQFKIRRTVYRIKNTAYDPVHNPSKTILCMGTPKTSTSIREIPLPFNLVNDIEKHRKEPKTFLLTGTLQCMEPRNIQKRYKKILQQLGLRYLNFHSLRHSFATLSIQNGSDYRTIAELLGHSSVNTTLNIYVHSDINQKRKCLELLLNE